MRVTSPPFTGFDNVKLESPLKLQENGQPKSAKYTFAKLAQASGTMPESKEEAEAWFNQHIRAGMEAAGFQVGWVKGDKALISTRENPQGEVVDFVRGAGSNDPGYCALAWQPQADGSSGDGMDPAVSDPLGMTDPMYLAQKRLSDLLAREHRRNNEQVERDLQQRLRAQKIDVT